MTQLLSTVTLGHLRYDFFQNRFGGLTLFVCDIDNVDDLGLATVIRQIDLT